LIHGRKNERDNTRRMRYMRGASLGEGKGVALVGGSQASIFQLKMKCIIGKVNSLASTVRRSNLMNLNQEAA
jgi:hypothetical protein